MFSERSMRKCITVLRYILSVLISGICFYELWQRHVVIMSEDQQGTGFKSNSNQYRLQSVLLKFCTHCRHDALMMILFQYNKRI